MSLKTTNTHIQTSFHKCPVLSHQAQFDGLHENVYNAQGKLTSACAPVQFGWLVVLGFTAL